MEYINILDCVQSGKIRGERKYFQDRFDPVEDQDDKDFSNDTDLLKVLSLIYFMSPKNTGKTEKL